MLNSILHKLKPDSIPSWGRLSAQNMIEHLVEAVQHTNGKAFGKLSISPEEAYKEKLLRVNGDFEIPQGAKGFLSDATEKKRFKDLSTAIAELNKEIVEFENYFQADGRTAIHQAFGPMNYREWLTWHGKHFAHHFRQFGLLDE